MLPLCKHMVHLQFIHFCALLKTRKGVLHRVGLLWGCSSLGQWCEYSRPMSAKKLHRGQLASAIFRQWRLHTDDFIHHRFLRWKMRTINAGVTMLHKTPSYHSSSCLKQLFIPVLWTFTCVNNNAWPRSIKSGHFFIYGMSIRSKLTCKAVLIQDIFLLYLFIKAVWCRKEAVKF